MAAVCAKQITISAGGVEVQIGSGSLSDTYQIAREPIAEGLSPFRAASGVGWADVLWEKMRWTITGSGPADPALYDLDLSAEFWTVSIPGFADGSPAETWTVVPARPTQTRDRITGQHSWSLVLEQAD